MKNRLFIKLLIAAYLATAALLFFGNPNWFPEFYRPRLMAILALVSIFIIFLPRMIFHNSDSKAKTKVLDELEGVTAISLFINGLGGLGLYKLYLVGFPYDKLAHLVVSFIFIVALSRFIEIWYGKTFNKALLIAAILVTVTGLGWEVVEVTSDKVLHTQLLGGGSSQILADTVWDIVMDFLGVIFGTGFALFQKRRVAAARVVKVVEKEQKTA
ncbi:MAG: hypothetical protein HYS89_00205 [Candidatus Colwellbacteria bacterium]|nr:hypothetical protein [Candidatus Colwellbacteria bacterium]